MTLTTLFFCALVLYVDHLCRQLKKTRERLEQRDREFGLMWFRAMKAEPKLTQRVHIPTNAELEKGVWP
jgi:hypothetical protein